MIISCGIIGLPNIGKSTLFNYLTSNNIKAENYPFCTITQHVGTIKIFNNKLNTLSNIINNKQTIYQTMSFIDIAGLVKGSNNGEGFGNQFLSNIKNVQTICHLVRCFEDKQISHIDTTINPIRDIKTIETELILADYSFIEKKIKKDKKNTKFISYCKQLLKHLNKGSKAQTFKYDKTNHELSKYINDMNLLTNKPNYFIANVNLNTMLGKSNTHLNNVKNFLKNRNDNIYSICANIATKSSYATNKKTYNYLINKTKYTIKDFEEKTI